MRKTRTKKSKYDATCPCGSGIDYTQCCARWHEGTAAPSAESLMRSRYTAYVLGLNDYLLSTWHTTTRPESLTGSGDNERDTKPAIRWLGLAVKRHELTDESHSIVEFVARYRAEGRGHRLHETSRFVKNDGRWYYLDGDIADE